MHLAQDQKTLALRLSLGRMHITSAQGHARESHLKTLLCRWRSAALVLFFFSTATLVADP